MTSLSKTEPASTPSENLSVARADASPARFVRPAVRRMTAYHLDLVPCRFKLDQNEVPWELPRRLKKRVAARLVETPWADYPDFHSDELRRAVGRHQGWDWNGVLVGNGSSELIGLVLEATLPSGGGILGHIPSFGLYGMLAVRCRARTDWVGPSADLRVPIDEMIAQAERDPTRPTILCTPNNPTGDVVPPAKVEALLERLDAPLLLDSAYGEFCEHDYRPLLRRYRNLVILGTFSKAWSLAGLRLGYLLADPELVTELIKVKFPYNLNHATALAGLAALEEPAVSERMVRVLAARREQWTELMASFGFEVVPSQTNFLLIRCPGGAEEAKATIAGLAERGILVRDVSAGPGLTGCFRLSVGTGGALRATRKALTEMRAEGS